MTSRDNGAQRGRYPTEGPNLMADYSSEHWQMLDLIAELVAMDGQECQPDGLGDCRPHGYPTVAAGAPCPYQQARELLAKHEDEFLRRERDRGKAAAEQLRMMLDTALGGGGGRRWFEGRR